MKVLLFVLDCLNEETTCSLKIIKLVGFGFYLLLYPFLILWNVLGTIWFINLESSGNNECKDLIEKSTWIIIFWIIINYFLTLVYLITSTYILVECCKNINRRRNTELSLNYDEDNSGNIQILDDELQEKHLLTPHERVNINNYILSRKELLFLDLLNINCSICFDKINNSKEKILKLPSCNHIFHLNCLCEWITRQATCPNCRVPIVPTKI